MIEKSFKFQGYFLLLDLFKDLQVNYPHLQSQQDSDSLLVTKYTGEDFWKVFQFSKIFTWSTNKLDTKNKIKYSPRESIFSTFPIISKRSSELEAGNIILFQIKVLGRKIKKKYTGNVFDKSNHTLVLSN